MWCDDVPCGHLRSVHALSLLRLPGLSFSFLPDSSPFATTLHHARRPQIPDLQDPVRGEQKVGGLQVAVQDAAGVEEADALQELPEEALDVGLGKQARAAVDHLRRLVEEGDGGGDV